MTELWAAAELFLRSWSMNSPTMRSGSSYNTERLQVRHEIDLEGRPATSSSFWARSVHFFSMDGHFSVAVLLIKVSVLKTATWSSLWSSCTHRDRTLEVGCFLPPEGTWVLLSLHRWPPCSTGWCTINGGGKTLLLLAKSSVSKKSSACPEIKTVSFCSPTLLQVCISSAFLTIRAHWASVVNDLSLMMQPECYFNFACKYAATDGTKQVRELSAIKENWAQD